MSPRPRQASDADILAAAFRAIARLGPARLTLADVAGEAGVTAAALVQRFGSKRALLLAAAADAASGHSYLFAGARARHRSPLAALLAVADCLAVMGETPDAVVHSAAFLQMDLADADFRAHARAGADTMVRELQALLRDAVRAGELRTTDTARLARAAFATLQGSILHWTLVRRGPMPAWIRRDLRVLLDPYRA